MKFAKLVLVALVVLSGSLEASSLGAQKAKGDGGAGKAATPERFDRKRFEEMRAEGFDALYNLDYEGARRRFQEMTRAFPDHPAGFQFLAAGLWLKTLNESRRLQSSLYNTEGFYKEKDDAADPKAVAEFKEMTRRAEELAEARIKRDPKDAEGLYYLGAVKGLKAAFAGAVERSFMSALRNGSDAVDHHRDLVKLQPDYHDAKITIGMYDYVVGGLPVFVRVGARFLGHSGNKKRGLETLELVAREGERARDDAKVLLIALLKREGRFRDAHTYASELSEKYPRNYLFKMEAADALVAQAELDRSTDPEAAKRSEERAFEIFESLLASRRAERNAPQAARAPLDLLHYSYGDALLVAGRAERAAEQLMAAADMQGAEASLATRARLRAAQAYDVAGKRDEAVEQYKAVLARPNVYDSHEEAKRGLKESYKLPRRVAQVAGDEGVQGGSVSSKP